MCIFFSVTSKHIKRLFYPPKLGLPVSSLPLLMFGPTPRLKTCLCEDAGEPTRIPALALPLSLSSPNLSPTHHQIPARRGLTTRQLGPAHSLRHPRSSGRRRASCFLVEWRRWPLAAGSSIPAELQSKSPSRWRDPDKIRRLTGGGAITSAGFVEALGSEAVVAARAATP
jgi:hypothetical protein